ncbi:Smr/MutS family protein [Roseivivax isoporae]|uniref:DNA mismatch repair protein MutS n=1 Tax=Roseivivax isoporae LMG 25204 TaxID=1449351 RepID=X7F7D0_9RHOB|nr:Smr/MutS family protein [Roseivivax isoporae]ETX28710.1 DNA mismatch repair protein MutS [Roseivivax isoporae LMG 25204]
MKGRRPRPEELELWSQVARSTSRLPGRPKFRASAPPPKAAVPRMPEDAPPAAEPLPEFRIGEKAGGGGQNGTAMPSYRAAPPAMDAKAYGRMKRGKLHPEARIDLHGMTIERAHPALVGFILGAQAQGKRLVLVITGKGAPREPHDPAPRRRGVLKQQVPQWLRLPPLGGAVLQVSEAHLRHGGGGAYYVYLRRLR